MIVRVSGEDQYRLADSDAGRLHELENAVVGRASRRSTRTASHGAYEKLLELRARAGRGVCGDELRSRPPR